MATHSIPPQPSLDEPPLTYDQATSLLRSLAGSMKGWFPSEGGPSEVLRRDREDSDE
jgi:hypothetical protein